MKVLLISNQHPNELGVGNPIIFRMQNALAKDTRIGKVDFMPAYNTFSSLKNIRNKSKDYDVVHIHFGGLYALFIWIAMMGVRVRKFITFHGTDIHAKSFRTSKGLSKLKIRLNQYASFISLFLFDKTGFVAEEMIGYIPHWISKRVQSKYFLQPLGVDYDKFNIIPVEEAAHFLHTEVKPYVLFSDISGTSIKRRDLAESIVSCLGDKYELLIMSGVKPNDVPYYINLSSFLLLTSDEEGSPNIIRECLALNKPVFSVQVGDAEKQLQNLNNSCIISRNPSLAAKQIHDYLLRPYTDDTRETKRYALDFELLNRQIVELYQTSLYK